MPTKKAPPWKRKRPEGETHHLSAPDKEKAKTRAKKAGRHYPNLVDNMAVAKKKRTPKSK